MVLRTDHNWKFIFSVVFVKMLNVIIDEAMGRITYVRYLRHFTHRMASDVNHSSIQENCGNKPICLNWIVSQNGEQ